MEARSVDEIPVGDEWQYEPKWDGFRCIAFRDGDKIFLQSKAGQPLARYFPDVVEKLERLPAQSVSCSTANWRFRSATRFPSTSCNCVCIPPPAACKNSPRRTRLSSSSSICSRMRRANRCFVCRCANAAKSSRAFARANLKATRRRALVAGHDHLENAKKWFDKVGGDLDGVIAKQIDAPYASGERTAMVKVKQIRSADCVVGGFRYGTGSRLLGSLLLGLYDDDGLAPSRRFHFGLQGERTPRADEEIRSAEEEAGIHRKCAGRPEPVEHGTKRRMGAGRSEDCR